MVEAIHTVVPGRVRYKVAGLYRSGALKQLLESHLLQTHGIKIVSADPLTGKVLVCFNSTNTCESIASFITSVVNGTQHHTPTAYRNGVSPAHATANGTAATAVARRSTNGLRPHSLASRALDELIPVVALEPKVATLGSALAPLTLPAWHLLDTDSVLATLQTSVSTGLSAEVVQTRLATYGPNQLPEAAPRSAWDIVSAQLNSLPVALLAAAAGISLVTGGVADAVVIMGVVALNTMIGYFTESQSERTIQSLKHLVRPSATVVREHKPQEISPEALVPGDVLLLRPGSYVAADSRLLEVHCLTVDESALTGESLPVCKIAAPLTDATLPLADRVNMVYMGTLVTGGQGLAVVVATGARSRRCSAGGRQPRNHDRGDQPRRTIYNNIRKSVRFLLTTNLSEVIVTATAITAGLGHPLNAMQLLRINLLSDVAPGLALAPEAPEPDVLQRPPRNPDDPIIKTEDLRSIAYESATLSAGALGAYGYGLLRYGAGPQASTLTFTGLITGQLLHAVTSRSETHSVFDRTALPPNPYLSAALLGSLGLQALTLFVSGLRSLLGITPVSLLDGLVIGASALVPFAINEGGKALRAPRNDAEVQPRSALTPALAR